MINITQKFPATITNKSKPIKKAANISLSSFSISLLDVRPRTVIRYLQHVRTKLACAIQNIKLLEKKKME